MASIQPRGTKWQIRIVHKLLPRPFFHTFDDETEARQYAAQLEGFLKRGVVPQDLLAAPGALHDPLLIEVIRDYTKIAPITPSDDELLRIVLKESKGLRVSGVTFEWVEGYVRTLKTDPKKHLAPGTIRKRIGVLGRVLDWHLRRATPADKQPPANPLRLLPVGYSNYSKQDLETVDAKHDVARDRRLAPGEEARLLEALAGVRRPDRERPLDANPQLALLFRLIVDTGLRLSEAYKLRVNQIDLDRNIINVAGSKGHRGMIKPRVVPLKRELREPLRAACKDRVGLLFDFWDGRADTAKKVSVRLSNRFRTLFDYAEVVPHMTEHDLRHEACCRWMMMRTAQGGWMFSELEICKIMGWSDTKMILRYASLRGEDLSARLG